MDGDGQSIEESADETLPVPQRHEDDEAFVATISRLYGPDAVMDVRIAGIHLVNAVWVVGLTGRVQTIPPDPVDVPSCEGGAFRRERLPLNKVAQFLADVRNGSVMVDGTQFTISKEKTVHLHYDSYEPYDLSPRAVNLNANNHNLPNGIPTIRDINGRLRSADPPWDGMDDVGHHFLELEPDLWGDNHYQIIKFWVDHPVEVQSVHATESSLDVQASASMPGQLQEIEMRLVLEQQGRVFSRRVVKPFEGDDHVKAQATIPVDEVGGGSYQAKVFIHWRGQAVGRTDVAFHSEHEETLSHRALALFSGSSAPLLDRWDMVYDKADRFEEWTVHLFNSLGWLTMPLHKGLDSPDLMAYHADHQSIWVVECTTRTINNSGKLGKLLERSRQVQAKVANGTQSVYSVIATPLNREDIAKHELEAAGEDDIIVLAKDDLLELAKNAQAPMTPDELHWWMIRHRQSLAQPTRWVGGRGRRM